MVMFLLNLISTLVSPRSSREGESETVRAGEIEMVEALVVREMREEEAEGARRRTGRRESDRGDECEAAR